MSDIGASKRKCDRVSWIVDSFIVSTNPCEWMTSYGNVVVFTHKKRQ